MSAPRPLEEQLLAPALRVVDAFAKSCKGSAFEARLQVLEAAASRLGGYDLQQYHRAFRISPIAATKVLALVGAEIVSAIEQSAIPPALALSALAREPLNVSARRNTGAYHTDFRLALYLAKSGLADSPDPQKIVDPACGTGILLAAVIHSACGRDRRKATEWLRNRISAADLSMVSLRGALLALSSFTSDLEALKEMRSRWRCQDSLLAAASSWAEIAPDGFGLVIGNPPWEKVKTTRHEFIRASGEARHYGAHYDDFDAEAYQLKQQASSAYANSLAQRYTCAKGEIDLYVAFLEMFMNITKAGARTAVLVPAGLIRSQRNEDLRRLVFTLSRDISITIFENRARFFSIDTRFKFVALTCNKVPRGKPSRKSPLVVKHAKGTSDSVIETALATVGRGALAEIRADLTVPEIRGNKEWALFLKMSRNGVSWNDGVAQWAPEIVREVDMTRDRRYFKSGKNTQLLPLVEGRMVQQHRFGSKAYVSGTGRSALWDALPVGCSTISPQFSISPESLSEKVLERTNLKRAGFCDITGQTNERSLMATLIPKGVVCGNKVPTITFPADTSDERLLLWIGIANSLPFDWLLRQVVTTTVNYFVLLGIPLPKIAKDSLPGRQIIEASRRLHDIDNSSAYASGTEIGELRAKIDVVVAVAYGMQYRDLEMMLRNFPLLDRGQPALPGEAVSTITKDLILLAAAKRLKQASRALASRVSEATVLGAVPYVPAEHMANAEEPDMSHG